MIAEHSAHRTSNPGVQGSKPTHALCTLLQMQHLTMPQNANSDVLLLQVVELLQVFKNM